MAGNLESEFGGLSQVKAVDSVEAVLPAGSLTAWTTIGSAGRHVNDAHKWHSEIRYE